MKTIAIQQYRHTGSIRTINKMTLELSSVKVLNDGNKIPVLGLGTYISTEDAIQWALRDGYRLIDTAWVYNIEDEVGAAMRKSGIPRENIFVVDKLWNDSHGKENTVKAFEHSLKRLGLEYMDLYLMHSAMGGKTVETWDTMIELKEKGLVKSIGVANFNAHHLRQLKLARPNHIPAVNQVELHPFLAWDECVSCCQQEGIAVMAYSPLAKGEKLDNPTLGGIAKKYNKSPAQIMIRWSLQRGFVCIPKTITEERIRENADVFDFSISDEDMQVLNGLDEHYISDWPGAMDHPWEP